MPRIEHQADRSELDQAHHSSFVPDVPVNWSDPDPQTAGEALDDLAATANYVTLISAPEGLVI